MLAIINGAESQAKEETGINSEEIRENIREETDEADEADETDETDEVDEIEGICNKDR